MEQSDYIKEVMDEMPDAEFLKITLEKLDEVTIATEEELLLLDKVLYKLSTISRDFKLKLLSPELKEKFIQRMNEMKLDDMEFMNTVKANVGNKEPNTKPKTVTPLKIAVPDTELKASKGVKGLKHEEKQPYYGRSMEKDNKALKRARSSSSSSNDSVKKEDDIQERINKLKERMTQYDAPETISASKQTSRPSAKFSFSLKMPESAENPLMHRPSSEDPYFERSNKAREPRSERKDPYSEWGNQDRESRWEKVDTFSHSNKQACESRWEKEDRGTEKSYQAPESRWEKVDTYYESNNQAGESRWEKEDRDFRHEPELSIPVQTHKLHSPQRIYRSKTYKPPLNFKR